MPTIGLTSIGSNVYNPIDTAQAQRFVMPESGDVSKLTVYGNATLSLKGAIYNSDGNNPTTLVAVTNETTMSGTGWYDLTFSTPVSLSSGTYHMAVMLNGSFVLNYNPAGGTRMTYFANQNYASPLTTWSGGTPTDGFDLSIYATYTAGGGGSPATGFMTPNTRLW